MFKGMERGFGHKCATMQYWYPNIALRGYIFFTYMFSLQTISHSKFWRCPFCVPTFFPQICWMSSLSKSLHWEESPLASSCYPNMCSTHRFRVTPSVFLYLLQFFGNLAYFMNFYSFYLSGCMWLAIFTLILKSFCPFLLPSLCICYLLSQPRHESSPGRENTANSFIGIDIGQRRLLMSRVPIS